jgi:xanthine dehydrogenase accessory factor
VSDLDPPPPHLLGLLADAASPHAITSTPNAPAPVDVIYDDIYEALVACRRAEAPCVLCTVVTSAGSSPRKAGAHMLVIPSAAAGAPRIIGTIGGGAIEHEVITEALASLREGTPRLVERHLTQELGMCCGGRMSVFLEPQVYAPPLWLFGAGHVSAPLAQVAALAGFSVTIIDARPDQATAARFPTAKQVLCEPPLLALDHLLPPADPARTFALVLTHDHALDEAITARLLPWPLAYVGVIGSVRKREKFKQRLRASGTPDDLISHMHTPIGLDIGAITPAEIAVSAVAELILIRRALGSGAPMHTLSRTPTRRAETP